MNEPILTLIIGIGVLIILFLIFFPSKGVISILRKGLINSQKERIEDALKHIYDCEYNRTNCSNESLAGSLNLSTDKAVKLITQLESKGLLKPQGANLELTTEGRNYALRIIRVHRLWERYLADETSISETDWHNEAEFKEHTLSTEEADKLAAQIGNPLVDPHGDPIPSPSGEIPKLRGVPFTELEIGRYAKIVHLEDEPTEIYKQLVALNLSVGQQVRILELSADRIRFEANGEESVLAPSFANNITVKLLPDTFESSKQFRTLADLKKGEEGKVMGISNLCRGQQRRRLLDLGVVPGTVIRAELVSVGGNAVGYRIRGAVIAVRKNHASQIFIN